MKSTPSNRWTLHTNAGVGPLSLAFGRVKMRKKDDGSFFANPELVERGPAWRLASAFEAKRYRELPIRDVGMHTALSLRLIGKDFILPSIPGSTPKPVTHQHNLQQSCNMD